MYQSHEWWRALIRHTFSPHCLQRFRPPDHFNIQSVPLSLPSLRLWKKREGHKQKIFFLSKAMQSIWHEFCQIPPIVKRIQTKKSKNTNWHGGKAVFFPIFFSKCQKIIPGTSQHDIIEIITQYSLLFIAVAFKKWSKNLLF